MKALNKISNLVEAFAKYLAILGGLVLCLIALMVLISIVGRAGIPIGFSSIKGDFELVEVGTAFAILAFMPFAQLNRSHAAVSFFTEKLGKFANQTIDFIVDIFMLIIASILAWRLTLGTIEKYNNGEVSFILQFPLWFAYASALIALYIWVLVAISIVLNSMFSKADNMEKST